MNNFRNLNLLFLSRQGFWINEDVTNLNPFYNIGRYFISSIMLYLVWFFSPSEYKKYLMEMYIFDEINIRKIIIIVMLLLVFIGIIYENYYFFKNRSVETFHMFFFFSYKKIYTLNLIKNIIILLPVIVCWTIYNSLMNILLIIIIVNEISYKYLTRRTKIKDQKTISYSLVTNMVTFKIIHSYISLINYIKLISVPLISVLIYSVIEKYGFLFITTINDNAIFTGLFLGTIFFSSKQPIYYLLGLFQEIKYLKIINVNYKKLIKNYILILSVPPYLLVILALGLINSIMLKMPIEINVMLLIGVSVTYVYVLLIQSIEATQVLKKEFKTMNELENYKIPLKEHAELYRWLYGVIVSLGWIIISKQKLPVMMNYIIMSVILIFILYYLITKLKTEWRQTLCR